VVVLARHPRLVGDRRRRQQCKQLAREITAGRELVAQRNAGIGGLQRVLGGGTRDRTVIQRTVAETLDRDIRDRGRVEVTTGGPSPIGGAGFSPGTPIASNSPS